MFRRTICCSVVAIFISFVGYCQITLSPRVSDHSNGSRKLLQLFYTLNKEYIEELNFYNLTERCIDEVLDKLDPYASYLTREEVEETRRTLYSGDISMLEEDISVLNSSEAASSPNLLLKDKMLSPRDSNAGYTYSSLDVVYKLNDSTGFIRVGRFINNTAREIEHAIISLGDMSALILDLRSNAGGIFRQGVYTAGLFLPEGVLISYIKGRTIAKNEQFNEFDGLYQSGKLILFVDELTASTSELVAGALQDWDRALIIGRPTYGKGVVQRQMVFDDGSAVRLTVARYHTPSGRSPQKPYHLGEYGITKNLADSSSYRTKLLNRPLITGGGGIKPDIYIAEEYSDEVISAWLAMLDDGGVINEIDLFVASRGNSLMKTFNNAESYAKEFAPSNEFIDKIIAKNTPRGLSLDRSESEKLRELLIQQVKAAIAEKVWGGGSFYKVLNTENSIFIDTALKALQKGEVLGDL